MNTKKLEGWNVLQIKHKYNQNYFRFYYAKKHINLKANYIKVKNGFQGLVKIRENGKQIYNFICRGITITKEDAKNNAILKINSMLSSKI